MSIYVRNAQRLIAVNCDLLHRQAECIRNTLENGKYKQHAATLILTSNSRMRSINGRYGKGSYTTDVLSFRHAQKPRRRRHEPVDILHDDILARLKHAPYLDVTKGELRVAKEEELPTPELGYVILAVDYCKRMAKSRGMHTDEYLLACSAHALCHLAGMTHDTRAEYDAMRHAEQNGLNAVRACALGEGMRVPQSYLR